MVCFECYLPFIAVLLHFIFPYVSALVERLTGIKLQAPKPAVCPLPQGDKKKRTFVDPDSLSKKTDSTKEKDSTIAESDICCSEEPSHKQPSVQTAAEVSK